ncbi:MAG: type II secretion system F family protein [bacterium]|nr:type II secretion system F family protein [bacterium]
MSTYKYTARDPATGKKIHSEIEADSEQGAVKQLKAQGLTATDVSAAGGLNISNPLNRIKTKDKVLFSRQLSTLINAGLPLVQSLRNVANQTQNKGFKVVINTVITEVEGGSSFSKALSKHPKVFDEVFVSLVAAGEISGTLDKSLERLADQKEKDAEILSKVRGAMIYPIIVLLVMTAVVIFMTVSVLPTVEAVYSDLDVDIPFITRIMLAFSRFIIGYWPFLIGFIGLVFFFTLRWARTLGGKRVMDKLKMRAWPIGRLFMKVYMARFTRVGGTLVAAGVPLLQMMGITARAVNNVHIEESITKASEKVRGGKALSESIKNDPNFLELVPDMLKIGEDSGQIEQMLNKTADYYEKEVDNEIRTISSTIEPVLMIVMGLVAIIVVVAVLLPIYSLVGEDSFSF